MPLYEYACDACGGRFEIIQKFSEVSEQCRTCGKGPVHRLQSAPGIQFKGTGWYVTDYAQKGKSGDESGKGAGGEKADAKKSDSGSSDTSTKSDTTKSESTKSESSKSESTASTAASTGKDSKS